LGLVDPTGQVFEIKTCPVGSTRPSNDFEKPWGVSELGLIFNNSLLNINPIQKNPGNLTEIQKFNASLFPQTEFSKLIDLELFLL
jgi:hypothetical protein